MSKSMNDSLLTLQAAGEVYGGWKTVRLVRSMQRCAGGFELGLAERWDGQDVRLPVRPGTACTVMLGTAVAFTGYVDCAEVGLGADLRTVAVAGRDKTADLVDCSTEHRPGQWRGARLEAIAADLCKPFDVRVRVEVDTGKPLASFSLQMGESVFEALERAARLRGILLMSDGSGDLVLTRAGTQRSGAMLVLGENILSARVRLDVHDRFSRYTVVGQAPGSDNHSGSLVSQMKAVGLDAGVSRYRPLILTNVEPDLAATLQDRALWEASVRASRGVDIELRVQGWTHSSGLWQPNTLVPVRLPPLDIDEELLLTDVESTLDDSGTTSTLTFTRRDAFQVLPLRERNTAPGGAKHEPYFLQ